MEQIKREKSVLEPLENKSSKKANEVFLKLLAKQKSKHKDWSDARAEIYPNKEIKQGVDSSDTN